MKMTKHSTPQSEHGDITRALNDLNGMLLNETEEPKALPLSLLRHITNDFSEDGIIGTGGFATVYKGILENGLSVAVKRIHDGCSLADEEFHQKIKCMRKAKHKNIVRFLGYCVETQGEMTRHYDERFVKAGVRHRLLCFEYLSRGSLEKYITDGSSGLEWRTRYQIIMGICQGLQYLHASHFVHLDLKSTNILLDDNMVPKIDGFGISRCFEKDGTTILGKIIGGTMVHISPEYIQREKTTMKSDIYSLGVVILEILSGNKYDHHIDDVLESWRTRLEKSSEDTKKLEQIRICTDIALVCCQPDPMMRPFSTQHILDRLEETETVDEDITITSWTNMAMESPVTAWLGPMAPLLQKVRSLKFMVPKHIQGASDDDIKHFKKHVELLCRDLLEPEETSSMPKWWRKEVRELLYDTEDRLDKVILLPGGDFSELIAGVEDACERRKRLKLASNDKTIKPDLGEVHVSSSCLTPDELTSHKLSMPISTSSSCIVGLDELMNKLVKQLAFDDHNQKGFKVVPILGFPGVGKTTAAGTLYQEHRGKFQCSAFVRVSRTPDMRSLLISILLQIKAPWLWAFPDVHDLIDGIKKHLKGKRYFIVLDGLWTASVWDIISRAFPDGNYGSRIVTTTQINDVALACCRYYPDYIEMSPLNDDQSRRLFFTIVFGSEDRCPSDFKEVSYKIIKKCAGLPFAIVNVASLLQRESNLAVEKWGHIQDSLPSILWTNPTTNEAMSDLSSDTVIGSEGSQLARGTDIEKWKHTQDSFCSTFEGLKQVIGFIYNNLPPHLKTCLLYLSMYPEDYVVRKHDLVRQWIAEGFINAVGRRSAEEIAGDYFDELVRSGIVQPVVTKYGSEVLSCTVHHMVLDNIRHKSKEMNFIITVDYLQSWLALTDLVRRLSIQFGGAKSADMPENIEISKLRSLLFCGFIDCVPSVLDYEFLRVLILDIWADGDETKFDLTRISKLLRLRYLKIQCNLMVNLPNEISGLKYLETLEVDARLSAVPSDIGRLEKLLHLLLPSEAILPRGYGSLTSLLTLGCFDLSKNSSRNVIDLAELTNLQGLRLTCSTSTILTDHLVGNMKHLGLILGKLNNLRSLALHGGGASSQGICDGLSSVSPSPALLEKLELRPRICTLSRIPKWIGELSRLGILKIEVLDLSNDDIAILEGLASLTALSLRVLTQNVEWISEKGFPALKYFKFVSTSSYMSLSEGAMPNVQKLKLAFNAKYPPGIYGFKNMTSLTEVTVKLGGAADESSKGDAERVLKDAFSNHPSSPIFNVQWVDYIF